MDPENVQRRFELDWLRVMAILTVFFYHTTRFFNNEGWQVKNQTTSMVMDVVETTLANWIMALIFTISGASLFFTLGKVGPGRFIQDKALRLIVPLVTMGMLTFGVWQVYLERLSHGTFEGSLIEFLPHYFNGFYDYGGNFAWSGVHLWYLEMLFIFCVIFLPLFLWLKSEVGRQALNRLGDSLATPGALYWLAVPTLLALVLTGRDSFFGNTYWGGGSILSHATFFLSGFLIISHEGLQRNIQRFRWLSLGLVVVLMATLFGLLLTIGEPPAGTVLSAMGRALWGLWSWSWVLTILGFGMKHLRFNKPILAYANEAVLPFYILHHPVLLSVGYFVVRWDVSIGIKFIVIDVLSFAAILVLYELIVRRSNTMRVLFGMKVRSEKSVFGVPEIPVKGYPSTDIHK